MDKMNTKQRKEWMTGTPQEEEMKRLDSDNVGSRAKVLEPPYRRYVYKSGGRVHVSVSKYRSDAEGGTMFTLQKSCHNQDCFQSWTLTLDQCREVRAIVCNNYMDSIDYKLKRDCSPFLQGYHEPDEGRKDGFVLVEFWSGNKKAIQAFIDHVNKQVFSKSSP